MKFGIKSLVFSVSLVVILVWSISNFRRSPSRHDLTVPKARTGAILVQISDCETIASVGNGTLKLSLESDDELIAEESVRQGMHAIRIFWALPKGEFGFSLKGATHTVPFKGGVSQNSLGGSMHTDSERILASIIDDELGEVRVLAHFLKDGQEDKNKVPKQDKSKIPEK